MSEYAEGTVYYNDDACGEQAEITGILLEGETYYIRVGDLGSSCEGTSINWSLTYAGPPSGCTDPYACNYSPLATVDDGTCIYPGSPDCPAGPDLVLDSTYFDGYPSFTSDFRWNHMIQTGMTVLLKKLVTGTGIRYVLKFGVKIKNIGDVDYHLGSPTDGHPGLCTAIATITGIMQTMVNTCYMIRWAMKYHPDIKMVMRSWMWVALMVHPSTADGIWVSAQGVMIFTVVVPAASGWTLRMYPTDNIPSWPA